MIVMEVGGRKVRTTTAVIRTSIGLSRMTGDAENGHSLPYFEGMAQDHQCKTAMATKRTKGGMSINPRLAHHQTWRDVTSTISTHPIFCAEAR